MSGRMKALLAVLAVLVLAAIGVIALLVLRSPAPSATATGPVVTIRQPQGGAVVASGRPVLVHAVASSERKVTRIEVWVDGELVSSTDATLSGGVSPLPLLAYWGPTGEGPHNVVARATDADGERSEVSVEITATVQGDGDGDGVADAADACPDEPGWDSTEGCPDRDGDGVADSVDACADVAGAGEDGCPAPGAGDREGDGVPDDLDPCPDEPGSPSGGGCPLPGDRDGDLVADADDACPDEAGSPALDGCPDRDGDDVRDADDACPDEAGSSVDGCPAPGPDDRDGDGVVDSDDACPDEPGPGPDGCPGAGPPGLGGEDRDGDGVVDAEDSCPGVPGAPGMEGCPDTDGDLVPDYRDACPDEAGPPEDAGCPAGGPDSDGDSVPDDADLCPGEAGEVEDGGCPPADVEPEVFEGPAEAEMRRMEIVEFQALGLRVSHEYDGVSCYPSLAGAPVERYRLDPLGAQAWDAAGGIASRTLLVPADDPVMVEVECGADVVFDEGGGSAWGTYWGIGSIERSHPPSDWDGHEITARSVGGDDGRWFEVEYRLCAGSCDAATFPPPALTLEGGLLTWDWVGESGALGGYAVYEDGNRIALLAGSWATVSMDIRSRAPLCGGSHEYTVVAIGRDRRESIPSNAVAWDAEPCPRVVRVTFESLTTFSLGDDEWWADGVGPILGNFSASGSTSEVLSFNAVDYGEWAWDRIRGYRLLDTRHYPVQSIFDQIWTWIGGSMSSPYRAPEHDWVTIELGPGDDLTFGAQVIDADSGNPSDTLFDARRTIPAEDVRPGRYRLWDRNIELAVQIDVVVGPEAGDVPDLAITDVDVHEESGQLRVHVFNNAASMAEPADVTVAWTDQATGDVVDSITWEAVEIPSGGSRILQAGRDVDGIGGMEFVLDPDDDLPDGNRANNRFETPVTMRVEFLRVSGGHCSESGCSIFDCDREWRFAFWAGYGSATSDVVWVANNVRFPRSGELISCTHDICSWRASPDEAWTTAGDDRYSFEFEMPSADNLYVSASGTEVDVWTDDDQFGTSVQEYRPDVEWGAQSDPYQMPLVAWAPCDDALCTTCHDGIAGSVYWRITRVR